MARNPFEIVGAPNVVLETVKRGEADREEGQSVVLRLVERRGGQASVRLVVHKLHVNKAEIVNILEDHVEPLQIAESSLDGRTELLLGMRGFEIKTVKLYM
jgi:alpha-mannosidase